MLYDLNPEVYYYCIHTAYSCHILLHCSDCTSTCVCVWPCVCVCAGYYVFMWSANRQCVMENETRGQGHGCTCMCDLRKRCMSEPNRNMERDFFLDSFSARCHVCQNMLQLCFDQTVLSKAMESPTFHP